ncbi:helix-turn-helix domain-containing protein [Hymenobacter sp. B81]|uniref:helix-turn-helix domain-containing protein n=1 Tax=Hymenobacter sp. B81 TaxID=3344878 RepID=UPI0037DD36B5
MPRRSDPSSSLPAVVRAHFALTQQELARFVGVGRAMLARVEAGQRRLPEAAEHRLWVLARQLPPPDGQGPAAPDFTAGSAAPAGAGLSAADAELLRRRRQRLRFYVAKLRFELDQRGAGQRGHARRRWALAALRPLLAAPGQPSADGRLRWPGATPDAARDLHWLDGLTLRTTATPEPLRPAERALRRARLRGLEAELAELNEQLGETAATESGRAG